MDLAVLLLGLAELLDGWRELLMDLAVLLLGLAELLMAGGDC